MKIVFMGTPDFGVESLKKLVESDMFDVALVVTQPDRPKGRGHMLAAPPIKECALEYEIPVYQPEKLTPEAVERILDVRPEAIVVAAYGKILPKSLIDYPKYGCINVHASLLPKYRGAAPIQWAVINGDERTGVTIMRMDEGLDTGDIIMQQDIVIARRETGGSLFDRLSGIGAELLIEALSDIRSGRAKYTPQDEKYATKVGMIKKDLGHIDWSRPAIEIERLTRGLDPWPGTYTYLGDDMIKIWKCSVISDEDALSYGTIYYGTEKKSVFSLGDPGTVACATDRYFAVNTGRGLLAIQELQQAGKKRMKSSDFLRGHNVQPGDTFK